MLELPPDLKTYEWRPQSLRINPFGKVLARLYASPAWGYAVLEHYKWKRVMRDDTCIGWHCVGKEIVKFAYDAVSDSNAVNMVFSRLEGLNRISGVIRDKRLEEAPF